MSAGFKILRPEEADITKLLAASVHLGSINGQKAMEQYVFKKRDDGVNVINLQMTWEKLLLAARAIVYIDNPADVFVVSTRPHGQRAVLKFARHIGATPIAGRFTPGVFTNQIQTAFREPQLLIVADPMSDHQPVTESSYANIPIIALANVDSPTKHIDVVVPCNNKSPHAIGLMFWLLAREVLRLRGAISRELPWEVMPDLFFYRNPEEAEKEEQALQEAMNKAQAAAKPAEENWGADANVATDYGNEASGTPAALDPAAQPTFQITDDWANQGTGDWGAEFAPQPADTAPADGNATTDWAIGTAQSAPSPPAALAQPNFQVSDDWANQGTSDWAAESAPQQPAAPTDQWGGGVNTWN